MYFIEWVEPRNLKHKGWGDLDPATKKVTGSYGDKYKGSIREDESLITKERGFENIECGTGSPYGTIEMMHNKYKKEHGYE